MEYFSNVYPGWEFGVEGGEVHKYERVVNSLSNYISHSSRKEFKKWQLC